MIFMFILLLWSALRFSQGKVQRRHDLFFLAPQILYGVGGGGGGGGGAVIEIIGGGIPS